MSTIKSSAENLTLNADGANNDIKFQSNGSEVASIDQAGNLVLSGTLTSVGIDDNASVVNRTGSDGDVISIKRDGSEKGNIGINGSNIHLNSEGGTIKLQVSGADTYNGDSTAWYPATDNAKDLGYASNRFKDLYLSGGLKVGGTGAANALDDYEEGTWTPVVTGSGGAPSSSTFHTNPSGTYTKVGRLVTVQFYLHTNSITGGSGDFRLTGVPFTAMGANGGFKGSVSMYYANSSSHSDPVLTINGAAILQVEVANGSGGYFSNVSWVSAPLSAFASGTAMSGTVTFMST